MQTKKMPFLSVCVRDRLNGCTRRHGGGESKEESGELALYSPLKVFFFVAMMCGMLILMYFFYNILGEWNPKTPILCFKVITCHVLLISIVLFLSLSLHHYRYILPGICLCIVQLSRCDNGQNWLWHFEV